MTEERLQVLSLVALSAGLLAMMIYYAVRLQYEAAARKRLAVHAKRLWKQNLRLQRRE